MEHLQNYDAAGCELFLQTLRLMRMEMKKRYKQVWYATLNQPPSTVIALIPHQILYSSLFYFIFGLFHNNTQLDVTLMMNLGEVEKITESFLNSKQVWPMASSSLPEERSAFSARHTYANKRWQRWNVAAAYIESVMWMSAYKCNNNVTFALESALCWNCKRTGRDQIPAHVSRVKVWMVRLASPSRIDRSLELSANLALFATPTFEDTSVNFIYPCSNAWSTRQDLLPSALWTDRVGFLSSCRCRPQLLCQSLSPQYNIWVRLALSTNIFHDFCDEKWRYFCKIYD